MDKEHLVDLITTSLFSEEREPHAKKSYLAMKTHLQQLKLFFSELSKAMACKHKYLLLGVL